MKRLLIFIIIVSSLFTSCDDYLSLKPKNIITPQNLDDVKKMVGKHLKTIQDNSSAYYNLFSPTRYNNNEPFWKFEDDLNFDGLFFLMKDSYEEAEFRWKSTRWEEGVWRGLYTSIGDFNLYLYELNRLNDDSTEAKEVKAEILFSRALYYLRLVQFFCPYRANEYEQDVEKYGLPILKKEEDLANNYFPQRLSQKETFEYILNDLKEVEELDVEPSDWNLIYNKRALHGLLAEFYMWKADSPAKEADDWVKAREYALSCIDGNSLPKTKKDIENLFNPKAVTNSPALRVVCRNTYYGQYRNFFQDMFNNIVVENDVYNLYDENDLRRDIYINPVSKKIDKFNLADEALHNITVKWRIGEMYLLIAESYLKTENDDTKALQYLNDFKRSRIPAYTSYPGTDILEEIIRERRREFLCEAHYRWRDMKRTGVTLDRVSSKGEQVTLKTDDYRYTFIIPSLDELQQNPNNFQNPGWDQQNDEQ